MFRPSLKITALLVASALMATPTLAMESTTTAQTDVKSSTVSQTAVLNIHGSTTCAMELMPVAKGIYEAVSPKVVGDSNLRKLVKKEVKPRVFSGKLSIKSARQNAEAASVCLHLLKTESVSAQ